MIELLAPEVQLPPRYQVDAILKETPAVCVYRVFDASDKRDETIKILRHELSEPQQLLQFKTEFTTLVSVEHRNIIKVYDFGLLLDKFPYFTMEYFQGRRMTEFFDGQNWAALYDVILQIGSALHHIHHLGIVHLDLKPSNILVSDDGLAKLMDFGVAAESTQLFDRQIRGTLQYMAPEVLRQDRVDSRADLYALGMTLYETVTGTLPGYGKAPIDVIRMHLDEEIRPPSSINPRVPPALEEIIIKLLEKDPRHRYASAAALVGAVALAAGKQVPAAELLVGSGELYAAPLIGRKSEVTQLMNAIAEARDGKGAGVIVMGSEGMGKSRIVRDATLRAQIEGARIFCGRCPINRKTIYAPFFEIFEQMVTAVNPTANTAEEIRRILRPIVGDAEPAPVLGQKYRLYNRIVQSMQDIYGFLSAVGSDSGSPLILIIDDLQWADPSTVELFQFLVTEAKHNKLLVIGTLTVATSNDPSMEEPGTTADFWEARGAEGTVTLVRVNALDEHLVREHVQSLLGEHDLPEDLIRWMLWESSGSPLNIRRIIDYLIAHQFLHWQPSGWVAEMARIRNLRIPGGAASILTERMDAAPDEQREVLEAAAVFGELAEVTLLTQLFDRPAEQTYLLIRQLVTLGLFDESNDGKTVSFPQIQLRDSVYASMPDRRRGDLHLRAAVALEPLFLAGSGQLLGQMAFHFARGSHYVKGIAYSMMAGDVAARTLAHEEAAEFYRIALELTDLGGVEEGKSELREKLADAHYRSNDFRGAMQGYQFLLKAYQTPDGEERPNLDVARVMKKIGKVLAKRGEYDAALSYLENALDHFQRAGSDADVGELLNRIAWIYKEKGDYAEAERSSHRALALVEKLGANVVYGYVKNTLGVIAYSLGDWQKARGLFLEALDLAESLNSLQLAKITKTNLGNTLWKLGDWDTALLYYKENLEQSEAEGDLWDLVTAYNNVGIIEFSRGRFHASAVLFEKSVRIDEKIGALENEALAQENLGEALEMLGRWQQALDHYQRCLTMQGFDESRASRVSVYIPLARLTNKKGDITKALEYAHKVFNAAERARDEDLLAEASYVLAQIEEERENYPEAQRHLNRALAIFEDKKTIHGLARAHTFAADLCLRQQKSDEAVHHAHLGARMATQLDDRFTLGLNEWVWGKILFYKGDRDAAAQKFETAKALFEELDTPYELGRLLFEVGLLREEAEEATQTIRSAIRIFERLDAVHDLERARGALFRIKPTGKAPETSVVGLYEIVKIVNSTLDLDEVLNRVLDMATRRLRAERGMIILTDPITGALRTRVVRNIKEGEGESKRSPQSIIKEVIRTGQSIISADARADDRFELSESVIAENILSTLCVPLLIRDRIEGAIYVDHREARHLFSQKDLNFLEAFADQAAIAIENARLYQALEEARTRLSLENETLRREVLVEKHLDSVVGQSEAVAKIQFALRKASSGQSTVLLRGESGTGKGLVARIIHNIGPRRQGPFIKFNCAALPETLAESELFGHEKGAFTGADRRKLGRFELANGGTIFLDEIGKVSLAIQAKLLRVVEDKEFERVGGTQTIKTDVKIITATNLDLERAIDEGTFREDLFYRLNIIPVLLPPLRERKDDIPMLAEHFIRKICRDLGVETKRLATGVLDILTRYQWPGNVRELEATLHRAIVMSSSDILTRDDFQGMVGVLAPAPSLVPGPVAAGLDPLAGRLEITSEVYDEVLSSVDKRLIQQALAESGGRIREAARRLGLARNTLKSKLLKYGMSARE
jgi:Nif-specific regulatory protein